MARSGNFLEVELDAGTTIHWRFATPIGQVYSGQKIIDGEVVQLDA